MEEINKVLVMGVGGGACNVLAHMVRRQPRMAGAVQFACANTDAQALEASPVQLRILLGQSGMGGGGKPETGREAAEAQAAAIRAALQDAKLLVLVATLGGGTGSGAAAVIARIAREMGIGVVACVTTPFAWEGKQRTASAQAALAELSAQADALVVLSNDRMVEDGGEEVSLDAAFERPDAALHDATAGLAQIITAGGAGFAYPDFDDIRTVLQTSGRQAFIGSAQADGLNNAQQAAEAAVRAVQHQGADMVAAKSVLVQVCAATGQLNLRRSKAAADAVQASIAPDATFHFGTTVDDSLPQYSVRVTVLVV